MQITDIWYLLDISAIPTLLLGLSPLILHSTSKNVSLIINYFPHFQVEKMSPRSDKLLVHDHKSSRRWNYNWNVGCFTLYPLSPSMMLYWLPLQPFSCGNLWSTEKEKLEKPMYRITPKLKQTEHWKGIAKQRGVSDNIFFFTGLKRLHLARAGH